MDLNLIRSIVTVSLFVLFILLGAYVYSGRRRAEFDAAARMPLEDSDTAAAITARERH
jgi:cbb3-type cytochrome oxidase subunit 3